MKYILVLGDGMADLPLEKLGGKTPLEVAKKPATDALASNGGAVGVVKTIPDGFKPGSDTANLSVLGYAPAKYYTGRSPLEAVSLGIDMKNSDLAVRCNVVTLSDEEDFAAKTMVDYSSGEISTEESGALVRAVQDALGDEKFRFYAGVSYRHCLIIGDGISGTKTTPPHDITGRKIREYLPTGVYADEYMRLYKEAHEILKNHPVNRARVAAGKNLANSIWLWGEGKKPVLDPFKDKFGKNGAMISAVDLLKGIAIAASMTVCEVEGATGNIHTNFAGKGAAAIAALENGNDFVYVHIEAPDESGHHGNVEEKILSIELIDKNIVKPVYDYFVKTGEDFAMLVLPDHPTPIATMTHSSAPVPFVMWKKGVKLGKARCYDEKEAVSTGIYYPDGESLMKAFLSL
ncbi:MAG: cofactor-independent phosphoglycerate mutase [Clostridiaceae bacterium]|jgi:2,3-bisphosphoglycerate-independent phosphoglycerate mutase|nr:cofactor-independent phosphoglycerate mutase [Clostridiaceae bacterium]